LAQTVIAAGHDPGFAMQEELSKLERHRGALDRQLQSLDHVEDFGNEAAELAQQLRQRQGGGTGRKEGPQGRIADSIEALTALLREDVLDCQRLQAAQAVSTFEEIAAQCRAGGRLDLQERKLEFRTAETPASLPMTADGAQRSGAPVAPILQDSALASALLLGKTSVSW